MTGVFHIDGMDSQVRYSVLVAKDGYNGLVEFPAIKAVDTNNWPEEDGIQPDLSVIVFESRSVTLKLCSTDVYKTGEFIQQMADGAYHQFYFDEIDATFTMRLVGAPSLNMLRELQVFSLKFSIDYSPLKDYAYKVPAGKGVATGCEIDGIDIAAYDLTLLKDSDKEIVKIPNIKENLISKSTSSDGGVYDGENVLYKEKDVNLSFLMYAPTLSQFWDDWHSMLHDLSQPGVRELLFRDECYDFYYKKCSAKEFYIAPSGKVWFKFSATVCFFNDRPESYTLLASEDDLLIETEDNYFININYAN